MTITSPLEMSVSNQGALNVSHVSGRSALNLGCFGFISCCSIFMLDDLYVSPYYCHYITSKGVDLTVLLEGDIKEEWGS